MPAADYALRAVIRVLDWNVNGRHSRGQEQFAADLTWDVALLQEVTQRTFQPFCEAAAADGRAAFQLDGVERKARWLYAAVLVRKPWTIVEAKALPGASSPERSVLVEVSDGTRSFTAASLAAPPASMRNWSADDKIRQLAAIRSLVDARRQPIVIGIDQNGPTVDHPDLRAVKWHNGDSEGQLFGATAVEAHGVRDVWREHLATTGELARIARERPLGPLAVSYRRGRGEHLTDCRYDLIAASAEFAVVDVAYLTQQSFDAGSDHAAVTATLELRA